MQYMYKAKYAYFTTYTNSEEVHVCMNATLKVEYFINPG